MVGIKCFDTESQIQRPVRREERKGGKDDGHVTDEEPIVIE